jgi:hypothetical protein
MTQTRVQLIGDSFDTGADFDGVVTSKHINVSGNAIISGISTIGELSSPEIKTNIISNQSGTGPIELKEGVTLPSGKNLSGNGGIIISGDASFMRLSASEIGVDRISNRVGDGGIELTEGATLPIGKTLGGDGDINISGNVSASEITGDTINVDTIVDRTFVGAPLFPNGAVVTGVLTATTFDGNSNTATSASGLTGTPSINVGNIVAVDASFSGNVSIGGTLTYEDVTNVDSVGLITARTGIQVLSGISTFKGAHFDAGNLIKETCNISSSSFNSDSNINLDNGMIDYRSSALSAAATTLNLTCGVSVNDKMSIGEAITVNAITAVNDSANYINDITIDGAAVNSLNWTNEIPSDGGSSGVDAYTFTILKTGDAEFLVIGNQTKTS